MIAYPAVGVHLLNILSVKLANVKVDSNYANLGRDIDLKVDLRRCNELGA